MYVMSEMHSPWRLVAAYVAIPLDGPLCLFIGSEAYQGIAGADIEIDIG